MRTIPAGPTARCTTSCWRVKAIAGVEVHFFLSSRERATSADPVWPLNRAYMECLARHWNTGKDADDEPCPPQIGQDETEDGEHHDAQDEGANDPPEEPGINLAS